MMGHPVCHPARRAVGLEMLMPKVLNFVTSRGFQQPQGPLMEFIKLLAMTFLSQPTALPSTEMGQKVDLFC